MINRAVRMNYHTNLLELEEHMYPLVDVESPNVFRNLLPTVKYQRLLLMTESSHTICRMISGLQTQPSGMDSSPERLIAPVRLCESTNTFINWEDQMEKSVKVNSFFTAKKTETLFINVWKRAISFLRLPVGFGQIRRTSNW